MPITISTNDVLDFRLNNTGGAKMTMRVSVWKDPTTPQRKQVALVFLGGVESPPPLPALAAGDYQIVAVNMIEEGVSGTYDYTATLNSKKFAKRAGDVNITPAIDVEPVVHRMNLSVT